MERYIASHSSFLPILASGLSGLFSALPRSLGADSPSWHRLDPGDAQVAGRLEGILYIDLGLAQAKLYIYGQI